MQEPNRTHAAGLQHAYYLVRDIRNRDYREIMRALMTAWNDAAQSREPAMFDADIAAVMSQAEVFATSSAESADQEWLTLRAMIADLVAKVGSA
ncbi:hypothetical protein I5F71_03065 [Pseudomonas aeruginosa]|nr:hypothetical protein [Pseudomonas aeruginosa]MBG4718227.1 hypothetical protein [Pseudomonas aeruginosa]